MKSKDGQLYLKSKKYTENSQLSRLVHNLTLLVPRASSVSPLKISSANGIGCNATFMK